MLAPWKKTYDKPGGGLSRFSRVQLCTPMNRSPPGSSVHEISQARILEWVAMPSPRRASWPKDRTHISYVSCICRWVLKHLCPPRSLRWHIKKQTHPFADKGLYNQSYGFSSCHVWCESWTINKAECWGIDAFELRGWRKLLRVPWAARRTNQSVLIESTMNIHWKDWCWSWSSNTLATWCEEPALWKSSDAGKDWRQKEKGAAED